MNKRINKLLLLADNRKRFVSLVVLKQKFRHYCHLLDKKKMESTQSSNPYIRDLQEKYSEGRLFEGMPQVFWMNDGKISLFKYSANSITEPASGPEESSSSSSTTTSSEETSIWSSNYGDAEMIGGQVEREKFRDRDEFDGVICEEELRDARNALRIERTSMVEALRALRIRIEFNDEAFFNRRMFEVYGDEQDDQDDAGNGDNKQAVESKHREFILYDFHILSDDGNCKHATARRGKFFLFFIYWTS